ncbi:DUF5997 family protein [Amnibacterium kyonggiense]|uniref:Uncharacterized protein n=1 Tax=Amnibacterium kyonggiense TaxID=595671 RepID=A0A4R7FKQ1_9MICO|nr:DUF5997 family protein [Amnibacterium kyonggiense]TDS76929.1 hypothetical protein CLV52_1868 [Amnibacterium kyonggiense]
MKPETAAKKLGVLLEATPEAFRAGPVSRTELQELQDAPPEWLVELRRTGPHPRPVVAARLGVSVAGLRRADMTEPLTTAEIQALLAEKPEWLVRERATHAAVMAENARIKRDRAAQG